MVVVTIRPERAAFPPVHTRIGVKEASPIQVFLEMLRRHTAKFLHPAFGAARESVHILNIERALVSPAPGVLRQATNASCLVVARTFRNIHSRAYRVRRLWRRLSSRPCGRLLANERQMLDKVKTSPE